MLTGCADSKVGSGVESSEGIADTGVVSQESAAYELITTPIEAELTDPLSGFYIDYDFNINSKEYNNKNSIKYGEGNQLLIIYIDEDFSRHPSGGLLQFSMLTSGEYNKYDFGGSMYFDSFYRTDLFKISYLPSDFYIEYYVDIPSNDTPLIIEIQEKFFSLQHSYETNSIDLIKAEIEEGYIWGVENVAFSPSGKIARITGLGDYGTQLLVKKTPTSEYTQIELDVEDKQISNGNKQTKPGEVIWLDDNILLITLVMGYKDNSSLFGIYYYNLSDDSNGLIIGNEEGKFVQAHSLSFNWDNLVFYANQWFYDTFGFFHTRHEISKHQIYDIIQNGDFLIFDVDEILVTQ